MKYKKTFWILWHVFLAAVVGSGFYFYRDHVLKCYIEINDVSMDKGIALEKLVPLIKGIAKKQADLRILSLQKDYYTIQIKTACIPRAYSGFLFGFVKNNGEWEENYNNYYPVEGITPSDFLTILEMLEKEPGEFIDKRILAVSIVDGKVEIRTGVTNHSLGGCGNTLTFEKIGNVWGLICSGHWIS